MISIWNCPKRSPSDLEEQAGEPEGSQKAHGVRVRPSLGMNPARRFRIDRTRRSGHQKVQVATTEPVARLYPCP
jgi:hypothetical protein